MDKRIMYVPTHDIWFFLFSENMEMLEEYIEKQTEDGVNIQELCKYCKVHGVEVEACTCGGVSNPLWERKLNKVWNLLDHYGIHMSEKNSDYVVNEIIGKLDEYNGCH